MLKAKNDIINYIKQKGILQMSIENDIYDNEDVNIFDNKGKEEVESNKKQSYSVDERETVILYSEADKSWSISTNVRKHITKLMKRPETYKVIREEKDEETGRTIYIEVLVDDLSKVSISPFPRPKRKREYTEEELQKLRERLAKSRNKSTSIDDDDDDDEE